MDDFMGSATIYLENVELNKYWRFVSRSFDANGSI